MDIAVLTGMLVTIPLGALVAGLSNRRSNTVELLWLFFGLLSFLVGYSLGEVGVPRDSMSEVLSVLIVGFGVGLVGGMVVRSESVRCMKRRTKARDPLPRLSLPVPSSTSSLDSR